MLASTEEKPFDDKDWIFEVKWDGYRAVAELSGKNVKLYSRNGISFLPLYPAIGEALADLKLDAVVDGEIVVLDKNGKSGFQNLQNFSDTDGLSLVYYVFDLLEIDGNNCCALTLLERKKKLRSILPAKNSVIRYSDHIEQKGIAFFKAAGKQQLEGIMAKRADSIYVVGKRSKDWLKIKHQNIEEAVIAGFTAPRGSREHFGSLILGVHKKGGWKYVGHTGTGFTQNLLKDLSIKLKPYIRNTSPFDEKIKVNDAVTWLKPVLVCNIKFTEKTRDGMFRHPVFQGLRIDKTAKQTGGKGN